MSIKWLTRGKYGVIGLLLSMVALPSCGSDYMDNSICLQEQYDGCYIDKKTLSFSQRIVLDFMQSFDFTDGTVFVYFDSSSDYAQGAGYPVWAPISHSGYKLRVGNRKEISEEKASVPLSVQLVTKDGSPNPKEKLEACSGKLRFGTGFFKQHTSKESGVQCQVSDGYYPKYLIISGGIDGGVGGNFDIHIAMKNPKARDRTITIPGLTVKVDGKGRYPGGYGETNRPYTYRVMDPVTIALNDRICKIMTSTQSINFGDVSTVVSTGKIDEREMSLRTICTGVPEPNIRGNDAWKGVDNNLLSIKIENDKFSPFPGATPEKKIGLKTNDKVRDDLFVEGSWQPNQGCGIDPILTNGTEYDLMDINVPVAESASASLPSLYWRLCAQPNNGQIQPGKFQGRALISIEYE